MSNKTIKVLTIAAAAAALAFATVPAASFAKSTKTVACKAKNGTTSMVKSAKLCKKKGGTVVEKAMEAAPTATPAAEPATPAPAPAPAPAEPATPAS